MITKKGILSCIILLCSFKLTKAQFWGDSTKAARPIFYSAEQSASFPGGLKSYYQFLADNLHMPKDRFSRFSNKIVSVRIIIDTAGTIVYAVIVSSVNENYNREALNMIKEMPSWIPAKQNSKAVSMSLLIPILFLD